MPEDVKQRPSSPARTLPIAFQRKKQLERDLEHITAEMYKRNKELADTNRTLTLLRTIDALVLESHSSVREVCNHIASAITQANDYPLAALFVRGRQRDHDLLLHGCASNGTKQLFNVDDQPPLRLKLQHPWFTSLESSRLLSLEQLSASDISHFFDQPQLIEQFKRQLPLKSLYVIKLSVRRRLLGLLVVGFFEPAEAVPVTTTGLLDRLSDTVGVALDNKMLFEENQRVLRQLKESNVKLRELDETKDDFISMASHQLRTPLTSVKGYLSMTLEGDAGKLNPRQTEMLQQAFFSSQRMVYLIADLLNVSRLKTGKFVIESTPTNLATLVEQELDQLKETAKAKNLTLTYEQPKDFPTVMLDETKIRQVIMNFADNAIYYTPPGGHIEVRLSQTPGTIELRVTDDGIGVPKSERHHLFTKFYRAANARKARPDGTGLGLFMAKKVVAAQGGSIIFDSQEGKGSTFGFTFSKAKLAEPPQQ